MLWIFDTRREFLVQEYIPELEAMSHEELLDFQRREEGENVTNRRKRNPINKITCIQKLMRQIVHKIQPSQSGISHNSPIKINGEWAITYKVVRDYMASKMNVVYVENDSVEDHLRAIKINVIITAGMVERNGKVKWMVHQ